MSAFSDAIFRSHPGNLPSRSAQWDTDNETMAHFASFARVHAAVAPYRRLLMHEASRLGLPLIRHTWLHYPQDPMARQLADQFMLGSELLVAPVLQKNGSSVKVYLPHEPLGWVHAWSQTNYKGNQTVEVPAPIGQPGIFFRAASECGKNVAQAVVQAAKEPSWKPAPCPCPSPSPSPTPSPRVAKGVARL